MRRHRFIRGQAKRLMTFILVVFIVMIALINHLVRPVMESATTNEAKIKAVNIINNIVIKELGENSVTYDSLIHVSRGSDGNVLSITTDIVKMNLFKSHIIEKVQKELNGSNSSSMNVPIGTLLGGNLFYGRGPNVNLRLTLSGNISAEFKSSFQSAGINQTRHQIYLDVKTDVYTFLPGLGTATKVNTNILVAETIIVGTVPDMVLNAKQ